MKALDRYDVRMVALSYRGFWKSSGRPSQKGIELDSEAVVDWALHRFGIDCKIVLWGQSIGAGVATLAAAKLGRVRPDDAGRILGLLLETPFVGVQDMLIALYPQKFLPYRYLGTFLMSTWDSRGALNNIGNLPKQPKVALLQAGGDEIVPDGQATILKNICKNKGMQVEHHVIAHALHTEVMMKPEGRRQIVAFLRSFI